MRRRTFLAFAAGTVVGGSVVGASHIPTGDMTTERTSGEHHSRSFNNETDAYESSFEWYMLGYPMKLTHTVSIPKARYEADSGKFAIRRLGQMTNRVTSSEFMANVTESFEERVAEIETIVDKKDDEPTFSTRPQNAPSGEVEFEMPYRAARFVQSFEYRFDSKTRDTAEYCQYPSETLYLGFGDCEDTTLLLTGMLANLSDTHIRTGFVSLPGHVATIAAIPDLPNQDKWEKFVDINDVPYTYIETTSKTRIYNHPDDRDPADIVATYTPETGYQNVNPKKIPDYIEKGTVDRPGEEQWQPLRGLLDRL